MHETQITSDEEGKFQVYVVRKKICCLLSPFLYVYSELLPLHTT